MSVDAGSPGGALSQIHILADLMDRLGRHLGIEGDVLPSDHFDLIGGSGLGAYVVLGIKSRSDANSTISGLWLFALDHSKCPL
jgi:hypothetical protein